MAVAISSDRMVRASQRWQESRERRFDGIASLKVNRSFRREKGIDQTKLLAISTTDLVRHREASLRPHYLNLRPAMRASGTLHISALRAASPSPKTLLGHVFVRDHQGAIQNVQ